MTAAAPARVETPDTRVRSGSRQRWCIVTCEYPPHSGGVSNHTEQLARAFAAEGDSVDVWCPPAPGAPPAIAGVDVHVLPSHFGLGALAVLRRALRDLDPSTRVLVQWVPTAFGWRMMNVRVPLMLASLGARRIELYVHEVGWEVSRRETPRRALAGAVHRVMTWLAARSARRVFVTVPAWGDSLRLLGLPALPAGQRATWVPIPSSMPSVADVERVAAVRRHLLRDPRHTVVVGHFGTFARYHRALLGQLVPRILDDAGDRVMLLVGRDGAVVRDAIVAARPELADRVVATGETTPADVSAHIAACDLMVQPYADGVSARRSSIMAAIALGVPTIANSGRSTEPVWGAEGGVLLTPSPDAASLARAVTALLADPATRARLGAAGRRLHDEHFDAARAVAALRGAVAPAAR